MSRDPLGGRLVRHTDAHQLPSGVAENYQALENLEGDGCEPQTDRWRRSLRRDCAGISSKSDGRPIPRKPVVGSAADTQRIADARDRSRRINGGETHDEAAGTNHTVGNDVDNWVQSVD